jgi:hypothetical protein
MKKFVRINAVAAALFAGAAQAADLDLSLPFDDTAVSLAAVNEFAAPNTLATDGNVALIAQVGELSQAHIFQDGAGTTNFAAIVQGTTSASAIAVINQAGSNNRAYILQ